MQRVVRREDGGGGRQHGREHGGPGARPAAEYYLRDGRGWLSGSCQYILLLSDTAYLMYLLRLLYRLAMLLIRLDHHLFHERTASIISSCRGLWTVATKQAMLDCPSGLEGDVCFDLQLGGQHEDMSAGQAEHLAEETGALLRGCTVFTYGGAAVFPPSPVVQTLLRQFRLMAHQVVSVLRDGVRGRLLQGLRVPEPAECEGPPLVLELVGHVEEDGYEVVRLQLMPDELLELGDQALQTLVQYIRIVVGLQPRVQLLYGAVRPRDNLP